MAIATLTEHDRMLLRLREIYDRPPRPLGPVSALCNREKDWGLAKYSPFWGWVTVGYFATFDEADRHRRVMERATSLEGAISHREDGAPLRAYELSINRLRIEKPAGVMPYAKRVDRLLCEAQLWAARRGYSVSSELCLGLLTLYLIELPELEVG